MKSPFNIIIDFFLKLLYNISIENKRRNLFVNIKYTSEGFSVVESSRVCRNCIPVL